mmetsp:Transcript_17758/g.26310  ORF Transcript_17758/g.26310 Transcript_17758/m.26310 type:complete len:144 (+) Transcript_17758:117-548(+)
MRIMAEISSGLNVFFLALDLHLNIWLAVPVDDFEGKQFDVALNSFVIEVSPNQSFHIEHSGLWIHSCLILCSITDQSLARSIPCDVGRGDPVSLIIGHDFDPPISKNSDARISCSQIDAYHGPDFIFFGGNGEEDREQCDSTE